MNKSKQIGKRIVDLAIIVLLPLLMWLTNDIHVIIVYSEKKITQYIMLKNLQICSKN